MNLCTWQIPHRLFTLFGCFGDVLRIKIMFRKRDTALIQFVDDVHVSLFLVVAKFELTTLLSVGLNPVGSSLLTCELSFVSGWVTAMRHVLIQVNFGFGSHGWCLRFR